MIKNLIFSGGSIRVLSYIGCLKALEEYKIIDNIETFTGTSSGGIFSLLLNLGYTFKEMEELCFRI